MRTRQTASQSLGVSLVDSCRRLQTLMEARSEYVLPEKMLYFERATELSKLLLVGLQHRITGNPHRDYELSYELSELVISLAKAARQNSNGNWDKIAPKCRSLQKQVYGIRVIYTLLVPDSEDSFCRALWTLTEEGMEKELDVLRQVKSQPPFISDEIKQLLNIAEKRICERVYDPYRVMEQGEAAYQEHREEWEREYAGQFIALHRGRVIDADRDKVALIKRIIQKQREQGAFRAYTIAVGVPILEARGPGRRSYVRASQAPEDAPGASGPAR